MQVSFFEDSSAIPCPWNLLSLDTWPARMLAITFGISEEKFCGGKERRIDFISHLMRYANFSFETTPPKKVLSDPAACVASWLVWE